MSFPIILDAQLVTPLHEQVTAAVKDAIVRGRLCPGEMLPSSRRLAQSLGISRDTVTRSYADLCSLGYVKLDARRQPAVSTNPPAPMSDILTAACLRQLDRNLLSDFAKGLLTLDTRKKSSAVELEEVNFGASPVDLLPSAAWRKLISAHCRFDELPVPYKRDDLGYAPLREAISAHLNHTRGLNCRSDQVIVFSNSQLPLQLALRLLVNSGDNVAIENPSHEGCRGILMAQGASLTHLPIDEEGIVIDSLHSVRDHFKLLYVTPSHQDPLGVQLSLSRRRSLLDWAKNHCHYIVEDGFDSDYFYRPQPLPTLASMDNAEQVIYVYSFWKVLFPMVETGCLVVPQHLIDCFSRAKVSVDRNHSVIQDVVLAEFLQQGLLQKHVHRTREIYARRRQAITFALSQCLRDGVKFLGDGGGLHLTVRYSPAFSAEHLERAARLSGIPMVSTSGYYADRCVENEYLIGFASIPEDKAMELAKRFFRMLTAGGVAHS